MIGWGYLCRDAVPTLPWVSVWPTGQLRLRALLHLGQHVVLSLPVAQSRGIDAFRPGFP